MNNLKDYLKDDITLVVYNNEKITTSTKRGIKPLLDLLDDKSNPLKNAEVCDRITGKASAMLLAIGRVKKLHSEVLSKKAINILEKYHIEYSYDTLVDMIINREQTGMCPMEQTVSNIDDIYEAEKALRLKVQELMTNNK